MSPTWYVLTSFGPFNPYIVSELPDHAVYPVATEFPDGFDLDYSTLLIGQGYYLDRAIFDYLLSDSPDFLEPMRKTLQFLHKEGLLRLFDGAGLVEEKTDEITQVTDRLVEEDLTRWHSIVREHWQGGIEKNLSIVTHRLVIVW